MTLAPRHFRQLRRLDDRRGEGTSSAFEWSADTARARQWVGVLQVPGLTLEILPKIDDPEGGASVRFARRNLLHMLALAGDVPLRERDLAGLTAQSAPLSECLMAIFARRLQTELLLGTTRSYDTRRENLSTLKGKLVFGEHVRRNAAHRERFYVERDELTDDTPLNRVLKATCRLLLGLTKTPATEEALRHGLLCLHGVSDRAITTQDLARVTLTRQSARFGPLLDFCRLILSQRVPAASAGSERGFSLLFDMNVVFERFVAAFVRKEVMPAFPWHTVHVHARHHWRYLLRSSRGRRGVLRLEPDMLICRRGVAQDSIATVDMKWKILDQRANKRGVAREDLYQLFAYAQRYACRHNVLLYPRVEGAREEDFIVPPAPGEHGERTISVRFVDLNRDLRVARLSLREELRAMLGAFVRTPSEEIVEI